MLTLMFYNTSLKRPHFFCLLRLSNLHLTVLWFFFGGGVGVSKSCTFGLSLHSLPSFLPLVFTFTTKVLGHSDVSLDPPDKAWKRKHTASGTGHEADTGTVVTLSLSIAAISVHMWHLQEWDGLYSTHILPFLRLQVLEFDWLQSSALSLSFVALWPQHLTCNPESHFVSMLASNLPCSPE